MNKEGFSALLYPIYLLENASFLSVPNQIIRIPQSLGPNSLKHEEQLACMTCFMDGVESGFFLTKPRRHKEEMKGLGNPTLWLCERQCFSDLTVRPKFIAIRINRSPEIEQHHCVARSLKQTIGAMEGDEVHALVLTMEG